MEEMTERLKDDHDIAAYFADSLEETGYFKVDRKRLDINMVFCRILKEDFDQEKMMEYLSANMIKINPLHKGELRFVTHYWIDRGKARRTARTFKKFFDEAI